MIKAAVCLALVALFAASAAVAADTPPSTASAPAGAAPTTDAFVKQVAVANAFEIQSSALAQTTSQSEPVKAFADRMVADHAMAGRKFKEAVAEAKVAAPPEALDDKHDAILQDLRSKTGPEFDKAYIAAQTQGHVEAVA